MTNSHSPPNTTDSIEQICLIALKNAFQKHQSLGEKGIESIQKNQFGDTAMRGDIEAEEAVIRSLKQNNFSVIVRSEEHGDTQIGDNPGYFGVLDGIDGSAWYKASRDTGRYGTLLGVYKGINPRYEDYIFSGIMEPATKRIIFGTKGKGSFVHELDTGQTKQIRVSEQTVLDKQTKIHIDQYWEINNQIFLTPLSGYNILEYNLCSSVHYANIALGQSDLALECTRKNNLEIAAVFGLIHEAGGTIIASDGTDLNHCYYKEFGQTNHVPVITASSKILADATVRFLSAGG